jgi:hypothetical protein
MSEASAVQVAGQEAPSQQLKQPWKEWLSQEIKERKKAEESAAWAALEERHLAYEERVSLPNAKHKNIRRRSPLNKTG